MDLRLSISKKLAIGFWILTISVIISTFLIYQTLDRNRKMNEAIADIYVPSVSFLNDLSFLITDSKMLIKNWVFIDSKSNTVDKQRLKSIHQARFPQLKLKLLTLSEKWNQKERTSFKQICKLIEDTLFVKHKYIMSKLNNFDSYNIPSVMFEVSSMVEEDNDEVMLATNAILSRLSTLIRLQELRVVEAKMAMKKSFDRFQQLIVILGIFLVISALIIATMSRRIIVSPLMRLKHATDELKADNLDIKVEINSGDEIQELAEAFNQMTVSLKNNRNKLKETNIKLESERAKLEEAYIALQKGEKMLKDINTAKDKFFAIIAHDLKNPFTSLISITQSLSQSFHDIDDEDKHFYIQRVNKSANLIYNLLKNLLDWSRSQTQGFEFEPQILNLKEISENNLSLLRINAEKRSIKLVSNISDNTTAYADKNMVNTIIRNLLNNAIKFNNDEGTVSINSQVNGDFVEISIKDTGIGLSEEDRQKIFRIDVANKSIGKSKEKGTGLGLILCKEFTEKNGGTINVISKLNEGSEFVFTLPVKPQTANTD